MYPFSDSRPTRKFPIMTWILIGINVLVFLYELQLTHRELDRFILNWALIPRDVLFAASHPLARGASHAFLTLITSQFIHGCWLHIVGNMLFLMVFGPAVEERIGSLLFPFFYLAAGVIAGLVQVLAISPMFGAMTEPNVGASGAIAGVLGAYLVLYPLRWITVLVPIFIIPLPITVPAFLLIGWWFIQQLLYGIASLSPIAVSSGGIAFWAHIGGFIAGLLMILPFTGQPPERQHRSPFDSDFQRDPSFLDYL